MEGPKFNPLTFALVLSGSAGVLAGGLAAFGKKAQREQHLIIALFSLVLTAYLYKTTRYVEPVEAKTTTAAAATQTS